MAESESEPETSRSIVVVDADQTSRNASEDLEDELDCQVVAMDSMEFDTESSEEVLGAEIFILSWDLEIRSGADLLEEIRRAEALAEKTVLIAVDEPTPELVRCALALGADGVCMKPYDAEEIKQRLERVEAMRGEKAA